MWDHLPIEALAAQNAGVGAGKPCAVRSWLRTLHAIRALPEVKKQ